MGHNSEIRHNGKVVKIEKGKFFVKITSRSACQGCRVRTVCSAAGMAEKYIETFSDRDLQIGDEVTVVMEEKLGLAAVFYSFFLRLRLIFRFLSLAFFNIRLWCFRCFRHRTCF